MTSGFPFFPQAADEPAYLTVGTDVSAKYRGAFCEAKIKTVKRLVKVKVKHCRLLRQPRLLLLLSLENKQVYWCAASDRRLGSCRESLLSCSSVFKAIEEIAREKLQFISLSVESVQ